MRRSAAGFLFALLVLLVAAPAAAAASRSRDLGDIVVLSGATTVQLGESANNVVVFHGPVTIRGHVRGSVVVFDGSVVIDGSVGHNVMGFHGTVTLTDTARVGGDLVSRGRPNVAPAAVVNGDSKRVSSLQITGFSALAKGLFWLAFTISTLILGLLLVGLLPGAMEATGRAGARIGASLGWGALLFFGMPIAALIVMVTVVGLPLGIALLLALWFVYTVGYVAGAFALGRRLVKSPRARFKAFFAGWAILRAVALVPFLGGVAWTLATLFGLGVIAVGGWRASHRQDRESAEPVDATPPPPLPPPPATVPA